MRDVVKRYLAALDVVDGHVSTIAPSRWHDPTPCTGWDLMALVDHLVYETLWVPDLLAGATLAEVGDRYEGDRLGDDPIGAWTSAHTAADAAVATSDLGAPVHTSGGRITADEYLAQMLFDATIHGWDLAMALGAEHTFPDDVADDLYVWFEPQAARWVEAGAVAAPVAVGPGAEPSARLIALSGRDPAAPLG
jgi:uncharacterized protein (TIGR03086 family)